MKPNLILRSLLLAAAALGLAGAARAADPFFSPVPPSGNMGLLGQNYAGLSYTYGDLNNSSSSSNDYRIDFNNPLKSDLDGQLSYDFVQAGSLKQQAIEAGLRAYCSTYSWGKPFVEGGAGYAWERFTGGRDNSFLWHAGVGAEFQMAPALTLTPLVKYQGTPSLSQRDTWTYGVKANYWVDSQWSITAGVARDSHQTMLYTLGTNFRY